MKFGLPGFAAAVFVALFAHPLAASAEPVVVKQTYPATDASPARDYYVSAPAGPPRGLVLFLHGCTQTVEHVSTGTRFHQKAAARGYAVVYAEQALYNADFSDGNNSRCWNWFLPEHQSRGSGEPATLAGITRKVATDLGVDGSRIYVAGISAGADMTTIMGATYPDLFAAVAPFAGCAYLTCGDVTGEAAHAAMSAHARVVPAFIAQGTADMVNNVAMGETAVRQWVGANDLADDGALNASIGPGPSSQESVGAGDAAVDPAAGDPCVGNSRFPCASGATGTTSYAYTIARYTTAAGAVAVEHWLIHGLNHAYPGGDPNGTFVDPAGPDLTTAILDFFDRNPMPASLQAAGAVVASPESGRDPAGIPAFSRPDPGVLPATGGGRAGLAFTALAGALLLRKMRTT